MDGLTRDLRVALRLLLRDRAFSATVILTLALCLGANTALFAVVHHVLLRPLPVPEPDRILLMSNSYPGAGAEDSSNSGVPDYYDRAARRALEAQALFNSSSVSLDEDGRPLPDPGGKRHAVLPAGDAPLARARPPLHGRGGRDRQREEAPPERRALAEPLRR